MINEQNYKQFLSDAFEKLSQVAKQIMIEQEINYNFEKIEQTAKILIKIID